MVNVEGILIQADENLPCSDDCAGCDVVPVVRFLDGKGDRNLPEMRVLDGGRYQAIPLSCPSARNRNGSCQQIDGGGSRYS